MERLLAIGVFAAAMASLSVPSLAQSVPPGPSQNVTQGSNEARREALFARMMRDPSNLDIAFEYAALSQAAGDLEGAIATLERMLVFAPGLPRLQFELGVSTTASAPISRPSPTSRRLRRRPTCPPTSRRLPHRISMPSLPTPLDRGSPPASPPA